MQHSIWLDDWGKPRKNPNQFGKDYDLNSELSEYESGVMDFDQHYALCIKKLSQTALHSRRELE